MALVSNSLSWSFLFYAQAHAMRLAHILILPPVRAASSVIWLGLPIGWPHDLPPDRGHFLLPVRDFFRVARVRFSWRLRMVTEN